MVVPTDGPPRRSGAPSGHRPGQGPDLGAGWADGYDEGPPAPLDAAITFAPAGDVVVAAVRSVDRGGSWP